LKIDWKELISKGPACKNYFESDNISKFHGLFGVAVYLSISPTLKVDERNLVPTLLEHFCALIENRGNDCKKLEQFMANLPQLELIKQVIQKKIYSDLELVLLKVILDINEYYLRISDSPLYQVYS
jgi:hypothetical protein